MPGMSRLPLPACALAGALMSACTTTAPVKGEFPAPLVGKLPMRIGVAYSEEFRNYVYNQQAPGERGWIVLLGDANVALFDQVFSSMFTEVVSVQRDEGPDQETPNISPGLAAPGGGNVGVKSPGVQASSIRRARAAVRGQSSLAGIDAVIEPVVESYEFAIPTDWNTNSYTVWITYRMNMYDAGGRLVASWPVRAYGQSRHQAFNADESLADATRMALRDAGAYLSVYFKDEPAVREWLREQGINPTAGPRRPRGPTRR